MLSVSSAGPLHPSYNGKGLGEKGFRVAGISFSSFFFGLFGLSPVQRCFLGGFWRLRGWDVWGCFGFGMFGSFVPSR